MIDLKELRKQLVELSKFNFHANVDVNQLTSLLDRIEAAEKVCDAAVSYCNPDDGDVCYLDFVEIVERWQQEVNKCADQQQKK